MPSFHTQAEKTMGKKMHLWFSSCLLLTSCWPACLSPWRWTCAGWSQRASPPECSGQKPCSPPLGCWAAGEAARSQADPDTRTQKDWTSKQQFLQLMHMELGLMSNRMMTHHFKPLDEAAKVGVLLVVGNEGRLHSFPSTFNIHTRPIHLGQIHPLQVPQTPEQNL